MRYAIAFFALAIVATAASAARAETVEAILQRAGSADAALSDVAIAELRSGGPAALDRLFEIRNKLVASKSGSEDKTSTQTLDTIIDRVGGQRYCTASRLFWHTDLAAAQTAAQESGKPILSLRMMGNLTDEFSCANSRFFRTSLYANQEISNYLRDNFVLHWKSVRPVPKVTIDFGDGRKLERTLTGNSIHYVLAADGKPIDALPGLYGPAAFLKKLKLAHEAAAIYAKINSAQRRELLVLYHTQQLDTLIRAWQADLAKLQAAAALNSVTEEKPQADVPAAPRADKAAEIARPKAILEMPIIRAVAAIRTLEASTTDAQWEQIAALHAPEARLDRASIDLIRKQNPTAVEAGAVAITKRRVEDPILKLVANFQSSIALDTVRNEYLLHRKIHQWFVDGTADPDVEKLNERVYAELFLTPKTDPWIGLAPQDAYTALENGGVVRAAIK